MKNQYFFAVPHNYFVRSGTRMQRKPKRLRREGAPPGAADAAGYPRTCSARQRWRDRLCGAGGAMHKKRRGRSLVFFGSRTKF